MIPSDPAECAMESRIAQEWDILGKYGKSNVKQYG